MRDKEIIFSIDGVKQTWRGKLSTLIKQYPMAKIHGVQEFKQEDNV